MPELRLAKDKRVWPWTVAAATVLTLAGVSLRVVSYQHAGPLWRDEANSANLAALGSWQAILSHAHYDSFPLLWNALLWLWGSWGGTSDAHYRVLGLIGGLAQLLALWWAMRVASDTPPVLSLLLYGLAPPAVVWGSMFRGYGISAAILLVAWAHLALVLRNPSAGRMVALGLWSVAAVQANFANGVLLASTYAAAAFVAASQKPQDRRVWLALAGSFAAATLSLAFCTPWIRYAFAVGELEQRPVSLLAIANVWLASSATTPPWFVFLWLAGIVVSGVGLWRSWRTRTGAPATALAALTLALAPPTFLVYFRYVARLPSEHWHFLPLNALLAAAVDVLACAALRTRAGVQAALAASVASAGLLVTWYNVPAVSVRMSNVDVVADALRQQARAHDLVVVVPWYCGVSFHRYYRGAAPWLTLPDVADHRFHYHLEIRRKMTRGQDAIVPELARIERTLQAGGRVWLVGDLPLPPPGQSPPRLPPAPHPETGWRAGPYLQAWEMQAAVLLRDRAGEVRGLQLPLAAFVNPRENLPLTVIEGWRH